MWLGLRLTGDLAGEGMAATISGVGGLSLGTLCVLLRLLVLSAPASSSWERRPRRLGAGTSGASSDVSWLGPCLAGMSGASSARSSSILLALALADELVEQLASEADEAAPPDSGCESSNSCPHVASTSSGKPKHSRFEEATPSAHLSEGRFAGGGVKECTLRRVRLGAHNGVDGAANSNTSSACITAALFGARRKSSMLRCFSGFARSRC
mmetsp:Transcript_104158/g.334099  ORF Transcript_104158/g.334099 Transcript_104158/m.334099 type:complete len:211 (+) Transcript_104158:1585-2217(+)